MPLFYNIMNLSEYEEKSFPPDTYITKSFCKDLFGVHLHHKGRGLKRVALWRVMHEL